ncbi:hypothetical protein SLEP1_g47705 [Rubroshorea leprosula]|uniref:Uncharacterized protein n=1 Tax=Rubroshorea leprosula TaxID=152421 RepID=A0AAV5LS82_9ROSI|nr:hypothetical protein SLEP1_g47705 [Rubroshorea leprosula]
MVLQFLNPSPSIPTALMSRDLLMSAVLLAFQYVQLRFPPSFPHSQNNQDFHMQSAGLINRRGTHADRAANGSSEFRMQTHSFDCDS